MDLGGSLEGVEVTGYHDAPSKGMKGGCGNSWVRLTHTPSQTTIILYGDSCQHKTRQAGLLLMELALEFAASRGCLKCSYPDALKEKNGSV